jgi:hypothetical protein
MDLAFDASWWRVSQRNTDMNRANHFELRRRSLLLASLSTLAGCGGVDSGGTGTGAAATYAQGPITGFGSIIVNGVRYDELGATIDDDEGRSLARTDLKLGMRTELLASAVMTTAGLSTASAASIRVRSEIIGPLEALDGSSALTVLGQTIAVVATTVLDLGAGSTLATLLPGEVLEIHASFDVAGGRYVASRIERRAGAAAYKLRGVVSSLALAAKTLKVGAATIDWSGAAPADPANVLAPGRSLRLSLVAGPVAGVWRATAITSAQPLLEDRAFAQIEGRVTSLTSSTQFQLDGVAVDASAASLPNGGAGIVLGAKLEVSGSLRNGVLAASRVELEDDDGGDAAFELEGRIDAVDTAAMRFSVRGVNIMWSAATRFDSSSAADIVVGRKAEIKGRLSADRSLIEASLIHIER